MSFSQLSNKITNEVVKIRPQGKNFDPNQDEEKEVMLYTMIEGLPRLD